MEMAGGGATAENFLLPLLIGISILAFIMTATLALSPTDAELRADAALLQRIEDIRGGGHIQPAAADSTGRLRSAVPPPHLPGRGQPRHPGTPPGREQRTSYAPVTVAATRRPHAAWSLPRPVTMASVPANHSQPRHSSRSQAVHTSSRRRPDRSRRRTAVGRLAAADLPGTVRAEQAACDSLAPD